MPGAGKIDDVWQEDGLLYAPHVLAVLPHMKAAGLSGSADEFYFRTSLGRFFSHVFKSKHLAMNFFTQALDISE